MSDSLGTSSERAEFYNEVAHEAVASEPTTFTSDAVYAAASRLHAALGLQLANADVIRGRPGRSTAPSSPDRGWLRRLGRRRRPVRGPVQIPLG